MRIAKIWDKYGGYNSSYWGCNWSQITTLTLRWSQRTQTWTLFRQSDLSRALNKRCYSPMYNPSPFLPYHQNYCLCNWCLTNQANLSNSLECNYMCNNNAFFHPNPSPQVVVMNNRRHRCFCWCWLQLLLWYLRHQRLDFQGGQKNQSTQAPLRCNKGWCPAPTSCSRNPHRNH